MPISGDNTIDMDPTWYSEWYQTVLDYAGETFEYLEDTVGSVQETLESVEWQQYWVTIKDNSWNVASMVGQGILVATEYSYIGLEKAVIWTDYTVRELPKLAFNTGSWIPGISAMVAVARGVQNLVDIFLSLTLKPIFRLAFGGMSGPSNVVIGAKQDLFNIWARTVRASTEWIPIVGNMMWFQYDMHALTLTQEEKELLPFGVFWG